MGRSFLGLTVAGIFKGTDVHDDELEEVTGTMAFISESLVPLPDQEGIADCGVNGCTACPCDCLITASCIGIECDNEAL